MNDEYHDILFEATIAFDDSPDALARYIENGGDISDGMRVHLASMIRKYFPKPRGGKDPTSDVDFYMSVEDWRLMEPYRRTAKMLKRKTGIFPTVEQVYDGFAKFGKELSIEEGLKHVIDTSAFGVNPDTELSGLRKKYERGRKLLNGDK
jgi:hypothetical protein